MITYLEIGKNGRLGNQLFQYAIAKSLSLHLKTDLILPHNGHFLKAFNLSCKFESNQIIKSCVTHQYKETQFHYDETIWSETNNCDLFGYFQSEKYFKPFEADIRHDFEFASDMKNWVCRHYLPSKNIINLPTVSMHIRRGDYVGTGCYELIGQDYLNAARQFIESKIGRCLYILFSDDIEWCKKNIKGQNIAFSEGNSDIQDFAVMRYCDHNIICNSSFSWWAAWLNPNPNKVIIAPKLWFGHHQNTLDTKDLLPDTWNKI